MKKCCVIITLLAVLAGCGRSRTDNSLRSIEKSLFENPVESGIRLDSINPGNLKGGRLALYAILRTQTDYLSGKTIDSDSIARIATDYYGSRKKGYRQAMSWYSLGCAYSSMKKEKDKGKEIDVSIPITAEEEEEEEDTDDKQFPSFPSVRFSSRNASSKYDFVKVIINFSTFLYYIHFFKSGFSSISTIIFKILSFI
jgi:hypothetical protein